MRVPSQTFNLWADSFHEGVWACEEIGKVVKHRGGTVSANFEMGFLPVFQFDTGSQAFTIEVYGNYASWDPKPTQLDDLLKWGKPDLVLVTVDDKGSAEIVLAIEETAATPTGNQALQRCERQYGAATLEVPFWYLISEFGVHSDGGTRRDSVWPSIMGLEIMSSTGVPSIVLHYSDEENPEDYAKGEGTGQLFELMHDVILNRVGGRSTFYGMMDTLRVHTEQMANFVDNTWSNSLYLLGQTAPTALDELLTRIDQRFSTGKVSDGLNFYSWPRTTELPESVQNLQNKRVLIKADPLAVQLEEDIDNGRCHGIVKGSGSKPQTEDKIREWVKLQNSAQSKWESSNQEMVRGTSVRLKLDDFPVTENGNRHVVTSPRILYLYDSTLVLSQSVSKAFPRLSSVLPDMFADRPALMYISNSIKPGRIFGDPYTGQIASYSVSFGALTNERSIFVYFPHQSISQAAEQLADQSNKGLKMLAELTELLIFMGGYAIATKSLEIL